LVVWSSNSVANINQYKSNAYDEASLRQEFLNPLFRTLDWDMENKAGSSHSIAKWRLKAERK